MTAAGVDATRFACDHALVDGALVDRVVLELADGRIVAVEPDSAGFDEVAADGGRLAGVTLPGLVNAHSHAFHRVLRGRTHDTGTFWSWRTQMYAVSEALDPDTYHRLATAVFAEMLEAGITTVGEFHYLHHGPGGAPYADPNAMGRAILAAAAEAGIRITLLDALYLTGGIGDTVEEPGLVPAQRRYSDGDVGTWLGRLLALRDATSGPMAEIGAALHSVRAVPPPQLAEAVSGLMSLGQARPVLHAHVAEQPEEVRDCAEEHGGSPVEVLGGAGALGPKFTAVHGVWLTEEDIATLGRTRSTVCACPTTERDLADGVVPARRLARAGAGLALGSDQHAVVDLLLEARALELDLRLVTQQRGVLTPEQLIEAATTGGAHSLGWHDTGRIEVGAVADLCVVGVDSTRLAGAPRHALLPAVVYAATAADVTTTIVDGRVVVRDGRHVAMDTVDALRRAISEVDGRTARVGS